MVHCFPRGKSDFVFYSWLAVALLCPILDFSVLLPLIWGGPFYFFYAAVFSFWAVE